MTKNKWKELTGKTVREWATQLGQHPETIRTRLYKHGTPYPLKDGKFFRLLDGGTAKQPDATTKQPQTDIQGVCKHCMQTLPEPEVNTTDPQTEVYRYSDDTPLNMVDDNLSVRALTCLEKLNIVLVGDLRKVNILRVDSMKGYGPNTRRELIRKFYK